MSDEENNDSKWEQMRGDGGTQVLDQARFVDLKSEFEQLCKDAGAAVNDRREMAERTRFCIWENQHPDGRKHKGENGEEPFPFDGASDARVRLADSIGQEQLVVIMAALMRSRQVFKPAEGTDTETAALVNELWNWVLANQLGPEWFVEWTKLVQWRQNDSPALALMQVYWRQEFDLKPLTITSTEVIDKLLRAELAQQQDPQQPLDANVTADLTDMLENVNRQDELAGQLQALWPQMKPATATAAARKLQRAGAATFPYPYQCENRIAVKARRPFRDVFLPENTPSDEQRARAIFISEWFSRTELEEMDARGEFLPGALEEILQHEGESAWQHYSMWTSDGDRCGSPEAREWDKTKQRGLYNLLTAFFRATSADGVPGTYTVQFNFNCDTPCTKAELVDYRMRGKRYPFRASQREILGDSLWDTRGLSELSMTEQNSLKRLHDMFMDNASLGAVPPITVPISRPRLGLVIEPLAKIKVNRTGEIGWFPPPPFPQAADAMQKLILAQVSQYFARMDANVSPDWTRLYQEWLVNFVLIDAKEVLRMAIQLLEQYLPDDVILRAVGPAGQKLIDLRNSGQDSGESQWVADVDVSFEAGMLNFEYLKAMGDLITNYVLTWDTVSVVQRDKLVRWFFSAISPSLAMELTVPVETANQHEVEDESTCFARIAAGDEPQQPLGVNYNLRLRTLLNIQKKNPEAWLKLTPNSRKILVARIEFFENQIQQQKNAIIGATMRQPALTPENQAEAETAAAATGDETT